MRGAWFVLGATLMTIGCAHESKPAPAEVNIITGPRFWTGDPARPWADALLVSEGRIVRLLDRSEIPQALAGGGTVREVPGVTALPGLVDAHGHVLGYALSRHRVNLVGAASLDEALARIEKFAKAHPDARWIVGRGWDQNDWPDHAWPDADRLEQVVSGRPCALTRIDGHAMWLNRTALAEAGIDNRTRDPQGGLIRRDASRRPTGILVDNAMEIVQQKIPAPTAAEAESALAAAAPELLAFGLTGVHAMDVDRTEWNALRRLGADGRFPLRVTGYATWDSDLREEVMRGGPMVSGRVRLVGVKLYADGALGSRGARLLAPYDDEPRTRGLWVTEPPVLAARIADILAAHLQPAVHAIGDGGTRAVLDGFEAAEKKIPGAIALRPRVEHAQIVAPVDFPRFAQLGAIASMQPVHATSDMPWAAERLGNERLAGAYAWRSLEDAGATLAFGSDFPIESPDPVRGLYAAVTRQDDQGRPADGWLPKQRLTMEQAIAAFTSGPAYAGGQEKELGRLVPGAWCDVTVLDRDPLAEPHAALLRTKVTATMIAGQVVWQQGK